MLILAKSIEERSFNALMEIYVEGNQEHGAQLWPDKPEEEQIALSKRDFRCYLEKQFFSKTSAVYAVWEAEGNMSVPCGWNRTGTDC